jgi:hypothetical protein
MLPSAVLAKVECRPRQQILHPDRILAVRSIPDSRGEPIVKRIETDFVSHEISDFLTHLAFEIGWHGD